MNVQENFEALLKNNKGRATDLNYGVPDLDDDNLRYFSNNLNSICDQIHTLILNLTHISFRRVTKTMLRTPTPLNCNILYDF